MAKQKDQERRDLLQGNARHVDSSDAAVGTATRPGHWAGDSGEVRLKLVRRNFLKLIDVVNSLQAAIDDLESCKTPPLNERFDFYRAVELFEISLIKKGLKSTCGSQTKAAKLLNMKVSTLNMKIKKFKLSPEVFLGREQEGGE